MPEPTHLSKTAQIIADQIAVYLGPHTARAAMKTYTQKALGRGPETLRRDDVPAVLAALRPVLKTFIGRERSDVLLAQIEKESAR